MPILFALTLFLSAALSFVVQPLIARQLLPLAGGAPAVWTTCLVFFQLMLLAGYGYSHVVSRLRMGEVAIVQACLFFFALMTLHGERSLTLPANLAEWIDAAPVPALIAGLLLSAGLPYFVLITTAPLLQAAFATTRRSPYWLYAFSNAGSLLGLLLYPLSIESELTLSQQRRAWAQGFIVASALILLCIVRAWFSKPVEAALLQVAAEAGKSSRLKWVALSALTASLLASVTAHLSTDIAPVPLLWVVPLALYLLTYIITFARWTESARRIIGRAAPMAICFSVVALLTQATEPMAIVAAVHLVGLTLVCLLCHGELAASKPGPEHLTRFYLGLALGGVLGGSVNAIAAPMLFTHLGPVEYPLALVLAALVRPHRRLAFQWSDTVAALLVLTLTFTLGQVVPEVLEMPSPDDEAGQLLDRVLRGGLMFGVPVAVCFALVWRPLRFALCLAMVLLVGMMMRSQSNHTLAVERNFFGTLTVSQSGEFTVLTHGTTRHGMQKTGEEPPLPRMYYHRAGPLGRVFAKPAKTIGVVGLGCGAMAAYAEPGQSWTFFEIDPGVVRIAADPRYFTFLKNCKSPCEIVLGDARRKLAAVPDGAFDLLAIDAFSSDAVPVHLLTREAFELYLRKLAPNGRLLLHLSNRYLDLPSLAARGMHSIDPALVVRWDSDTSSDPASGKWASVWVIVARDAKDLGKLPMFTPLRPQAGPVWTDDYAPLRGVWKTDD